MKAGVFPPTLNYMHPDPEIDLEVFGLPYRPGAAGLGHFASIRIHTP